jgi:hypothetical protein
MALPTLAIHPSITISKSHGVIIAQVRRKFYHSKFTFEKPVVQIERHLLFIKILQGRRLTSTLRYYSFLNFFHVAAINVAQFN